MPQAWPRNPSAPPPRTYDRAFDWGYGRDETDVPEPGRGGPLVPIVWDGLPLNPGNQDDGSCIVVEKVEGWLDSPPLHGNDADRAIADGAAWGPKVLGARHITIHGAAAGPRDVLGRFRHQLVRRAASREPAELAIADAGLPLVADVRAGTESLRHHWLTLTAFRYEVVLTAADPSLYDVSWQTVILANLTGDTGRTYPREFPWQYAVPYLPNSATLANAGNWDAPVYAQYDGPLSESRLAAPGGGLVRLAALDAGMMIRVETSTLRAEAAGGLSRASSILPGSRPMSVPAFGSARWSLFAVGSGTVQLAWRSAFV